MTRAQARPRIAAVVETLLVVFVLMPGLTRFIYRSFPGFETWQTGTLGFPFPVFVHVVMASLALLFIALRGGKMAAYGIRFDNLRAQLEIAAACFIPVVLASMPHGFGVDHTAWGGALILSGTKIALLLWLGWRLRKEPLALGAGAAGALLMLSQPPAGDAGSGIAAQAVALFLTYALFVGFGEEILYRGYVHSRLNEAFGRPHSFFGVAFGWGTILAALVFGLTHVGFVRSMLEPGASLTPAWGVWTFFGGLVYAFVREKSGGVLAPALLHGLPQALASVAMLWLR